MSTYAQGLIGLVGWAIILSLFWKFGPPVAMFFEKMLGGGPEKKD